MGEFVEDEEVVESVDEFGREVTRDGLEDESLSFWSDLTFRVRRSGIGHNFGSQVGGKTEDGVAEIDCEEGGRRVSPRKRKKREGRGTNRVDQLNR